MCICIYVFVFMFINIYICIYIHILYICIYIYIKEDISKEDIRRYIKGLRKGMMVKKCMKRKRGFPSSSTEEQVTSAKAMEEK